MDSEELKLFFILLGCRAKGRYTEQHDVFFTISRSLKETISAIKKFWPEANGKIHIDAWRQVTNVDGYMIIVSVRENSLPAENELNLFFINLGGYKENEFEEFHYKMLTVAPTSAEAIKNAKQTAFYKHTGFKGAPSHIDDKWGIDVDDIVLVKEALTSNLQNKYQINFIQSDIIVEDEIHLGFLPI